MTLELPDSLASQPIAEPLRHALAHDHTQRYADADLFRDAILAL